MTVTERTNYILDNPSTECTQQALTISFGKFKIAHNNIIDLINKKASAYLGLTSEGFYIRDWLLDGRK